MQEWSSADEYVITVPDLLEPVLKRFWLVSLAAFLGGVLAYMLSFSIEPYYRTSATIAPVNPNDSVSLTSTNSPLGQVGRLLDLGSVGQGDFVRDSLGILRSDAQIERFIEDQDILLYLFDYDPADGKRPPTMPEAIDFFSESVLTIDEDTFSGLLTVSIDWHDAEVAVAWTNRFVALTNDTIRERTIEYATRGNEYLAKELESNSFLALRQAIYGLMEANIKMAMLATTREELAFKLIDPAALPAEDDHAWPNRFLIALFGMFLGGSLAVMIVLFLHRRRMSNQRAV